MYAEIITGSLYGLTAEKVTVETDISNGIPGITIVGLPDMAVREAKERIRSAINNESFNFPIRRITVNLAPAFIRKEGSHYDLPIAISLLSAAGVINNQEIKNFAFFGELALDGAVKPIRGSLSLALGLRALGVKNLILPEANLEETNCLKNINLYPVRSLKEAVKLLTGELPLIKAKTREIEEIRVEAEADFADVMGQNHAKRALVIAAAGGHDILMSGPPGCGKTMLANRLKSILPPLDKEQKLEVMKIRSLTKKPGALLKNYGERPFRNPHHSITVTAFAGGGSKLEPGELTLAHNGILFLDEFPQFKKEVTESLRQPLTDRNIVVSRLTGTICWPADFLLVLAMNPCPCGYFGHPEKECVCSEYKIRNYRQRLSGPLLDRIDLFVNLEPIKYSELKLNKGENESNEKIKERIDIAIKRQKKRYLNRKLNGRQSSEKDMKDCTLDRETDLLLEKAFKKYELTARSCKKLIMVSRTIADLDDSDKIKQEHLAEALNYRTENILNY